VRCGQLIHVNHGFQEELQYVHEIMINVLDFTYGTYGTFRYIYTQYDSWYIHLWHSINYPFHDQSCS